MDMFESAAERNVLNMKKLLILLLGAVMLGTLMTGCREEVGDDGTTTDKQTATENTASTDTDDENVTSEGTTTVTDTTDTEAGTPEETTTVTDSTDAEKEPPKETTDSTDAETEPPKETTDSTEAETDPPEETTDSEPTIMDKEDSPYFGKIAVAYGDSITHGTFTDVGDVAPDSKVDKKWCDVVSERLGFKYLSNYGQNGISISSTSSVLSGSALSLGYKNLRGDAEVIMIAAGTNDFGTNVKLGKNTDQEDVSFCGGLNVLCKGLKEKFPNAIVIFITPIDRKDSKSNDLGLSLDDYREKIEEIAGGVYGFTIVDGDCTGFDASDPNFIRDYMRDGVHPNREAHILYGEAVAKELLTIKK